MFSIGKIILHGLQSLYNYIYITTLHNYTDPLASEQRKRSLSSDVEVETLSKRPKNDATVQGMMKQQN